MHADKMPLDFIITRPIQYTNYIPMVSLNVRNEFVKLKKTFD